MGYLLVAALSFVAGKLIYAQRLKAQYKKERHLLEYIDILEKKKEYSFADDL